MTFNAGSIGFQINGKVLLLRGPFLLKSLGHPLHNLQILSFNHFLPLHALGVILYHLYSADWSLISAPGLSNGLALPDPVLPSL